MPWIKQGGAELIAVQTANCLQKMGHRVRLAALFTDLSQMGKEAKEINYVSFGSGFAKLFENKICLYFLGPFFLFWLVFKNIKQTDVLFPQSMPAYWIASILGRVYNKKIVWLCNEPPKMKKFGKAGFADWLMWRIADSFLDKLFVKPIDKIIVYSEVIQKEVKKRYHKKAVLARLGVDYRFFSKQNKKEISIIAKKYLLEDKFVLLTVGKLDAQKNQKLALAVLAKALKTIPSAVLVLVGDGQDRKKLQAVSCKLQVEDKVIFAGFASHKVVRAWYGIADLILFPSKNQTAMADQSWGFVPFEALCQGKLSVVSKNSGAAEILGNLKIGFVCPVTVNSYTKKVLDFYKNINKYQSMAKAGKRWVRNNLCWEKFGRRINRVLLDIEG